MTQAQAYQKVFGAAAKANAQYTHQIKHPVTGEMVYPQQIGSGKLQAKLNPKPEVKDEA